MTRAEYFTAHTTLCEMNKHCLESLDLIAKLDSYVLTLELLVADLVLEATLLKGLDK